MNLNQDFSERRCSSYHKPVCWILAIVYTLLAVLDDKSQTSRKVPKSLKLLGNVWVMEFILMSIAHCTLAYKTVLKRSNSSDPCEPPCSELNNLHHISGLQTTHLDSVFVLQYACYPQHLRFSFIVRCNSCRRAARRQHGCTWRLSWCYW